MSKPQRIYVYLVALVAGLALFASSLKLGRWVAGQAAVGQLLPLDAATLGRPPFMPWWWVGLGALVLWAVHWALASRAAEQPEERGSAARKAYLYLMQMAALFVCLLQGRLLVGDFVARFLRRPPDQLLQWPGGLLSAGVGLMIGVACWAFHRWVVLRDGDFGCEEPDAASWRRLYFTVAVATGVALTLGGAIQLLRAVLGLGGDLALGGLPSGMAWRDTIVAALTALALGMPLSVLAWHGANQPVQIAPQVEVNALSRLLFLRGGAFLSTAAALGSVLFVLQRLFLVVFGRRMGEVETLWSDGLTLALAVAPVSVAAWLAFAGALQNDAALGDESLRAAQLRRLQFYTIAAAALAGLWYGMTQLLRVILPLAVDVFSSLDLGMPVSVERLSLAAALVILGAPAWWGHWWPQQVRARAFTAEGFAERASPIRQLYQGAVVAIASALILISLGLIVFTLFGGRLASLGPDGTVVLVTGALATGLVALTWWTVHFLSLRADRQSQAVWLRVQASLPAEGPRTIPRETLAPIGVEIAPVQPIVIVDGDDGAIGVALVRALRAALPQATVWPLGLTAAAQAAMTQALGAGAASLPAPEALAAAAVLIGPSDALTPERVPQLAAALTGGGTHVLLLPPRDPRLRWIAAPDWPIERWIEYAVTEAGAAINGQR